MPRATRFLKALSLVLLACAGLRADYLLDASNKKLLASSPTVKALRDKLREDCPGFALYLGRDKLPNLVQLRALGHGRFEGAVNLDKVKASKSVPEVAIASLYFLVRREVGQGAGKEMGDIVPFLEKVKKELKHADPVAYGHLEGVLAGPDRSGQPHLETVSLTQLEVVLRPPAPPYPPLAKAAGIQDTVVLRVTLAASGQPEAAQVLRGHPQLTQGSIAYAMAWRFRPVVRQGHPVKVQFLLEVPFRL